MVQPPEPRDPFRCFERFDKNAAIWATRLKLNSSEITEVKGILSGAFGLGWLSGQATRSKSRKRLIQSCRHQIGNALRNATPSAVVELFELATYLKRLATTPGLSDVLAAMKTQYHSSLLQLAFAFRFIGAGASSLELEPATKRGCSDIAFIFRNERFVVECFRPDGPPSIGDSREEAERLLESVVPLCGIASCEVQIRLLNPLTAMARKRLLARLSKRLTSSVDEPESITDGSATVSLLPMTPSPRKSVKSPPLPPDHPTPDFVAQNMRSPKEELGKAPFGEHEAMVVGRVLVWLSPSERASRIDRERADYLIKKFEPKIGQTATEPPSRRVLVAEVPEAKGLHENDRATLREVQRRLIPRHDGMALLITTARCWDDVVCRHHYSVTALNGPSEDPPLYELLNRMSENEIKVDIPGSLRS